MMIVGHKAPHSFYTPEPKYEHAFDDVPVSYPRVSAFALDDKPGVDQGPPAHVARHLRPALRMAQDSFPTTGRRRSRTSRTWCTPTGARSSASTTASGVCAPGSRRAVNSTTPSSSSSATTGCSKASTAWSTSGRCTSRASGFRWRCDTPGLTKEPRVIEQQVLTVDMAPSLLELAGAPALGEHRWTVVGAARRGTGDPSWRKSWFYYYNYEKEFPVHAERPRRAHRGVEVHPLPARRRLAGPAPGRALRSEEGSGRARQPDSSGRYRADGRAAAAPSSLALMAATGLTPQTDTMPLDAGIKKELPAQNIR